MQRVVHRMYFEEGMRQEDVAAILRLPRPAVAMRVKRIRDRYLAANLTPPPAPGRGLTLIRPFSLSSIDNV